MLTIWGRRNSINVQKVMWAVGELGLPHRRRDAGGSFGELDSDEFGALNPNRLVPTIDDEGFVLWESHAIVRYLATRHNVGGLWPADHRTRAIADQWMDWALSTAYTCFFPVFFGLIRTPAEKRSLEAIEVAVVKTGMTLGTIDAHLASNDFVAGSSFTSGDLPLGTLVYRYFNLDIERPSLPGVEAWYQRLMDRKAYREHVMIPFGTNPEEWARLEREGAAA